MTTKAIAPSEIAGQQLVKRDQTFDNIVQKINQKLVDSHGNTQFTFNADTDPQLVDKVRDTYAEQGWTSLVTQSEHEIMFCQSVALTNSKCQKQVKTC